MVIYALGPDNSGTNNTITYDLWKKVLKTYSINNMVTQDPGPDNLFKHRRPDNRYKYQGNFEPGEKIVENIHPIIPV